jgi:YebC/PmpR family DNA-binding regulatory protein
VAGHSKWANIKHKKAAADSKRGKIFSRCSKEITLSVRLGGKDPSANIRLRAAIASARAANMPKDNIERAIKKGAGELDGQQLEELSYEGYAAGGVAVIVDALSDNRARTAAEVRNVFNKNNGNLGSSGAVAWMFHRKARFMIEGEHADEEALMDLCFEHDCDVESIEVDGDVAEIMGPPEAFDGIATALEAAGITAAESGLSYKPENQTPVEDESIARQVFRLIDTLEDLDDVQQVYSNADVPDAVLEKLAEG